MKNHGKKEVLLLLILSVLMLCGSIVCAVLTKKNNDEINQTAKEFKYEEQTDKVILTLTDGRNVRMVFGNEAVKILNSYTYADLKSSFEILLFVREYGAKKGIVFERANTELIGEFKLHSILYRLGYRREQTGDLDWDYTKDKRWYVNAASRVIGRSGV